MGPTSPSYSAVVKTFSWLCGSRDYSYLISAEYFALYVRIFFCSLGGNATFWESAVLSVVGILSLCYVYL